MNPRSCDDPSSFALYAQPAAAHRGNGWRTRHDVMKEFTLAHGEVVNMDVGGVLSITQIHMHTKFFCRRNRRRRRVWWVGQSESHIAGIPEPAKRTSRGPHAFVPGPTSNMTPSGRSPGSPYTQSWLIFTPALAGFSGPVHHLGLDPITTPGTRLNPVHAVSDEFTHHPGPQAQGGA